MERDEFSFSDLIGALARGKWIVLSITCSFLIVAAIAAFMTPNKYRATVVLSSAETKSAGGSGTLDSLASQFGGFASLTGISMRGDSKKAESIAVLQSEVLTRRYVQEQHLLPILFADDWDAGNKKWTVTDPGRMPTLWKANQLFKKRIRTVTENPKTGLVTLTITWTDPNLAAQWANDLAKATNEYMRSRAIEETERNIRYLNEQANETDIAQVRSAIYAILESEIKNAMLARGTEEYALKIIDPAVPSERHSSPMRAVWLAVALLSGMTFSATLVLLLAARDKTSDGDAHRSGVAATRQRIASEQR